MIPILFSLLLICLLVWVAYVTHPPTGGKRESVIWWIANSGMTVLFLGAMATLSEHTLGFPRSAYTETFLIVGATVTILAKHVELHEILCKIDWRKKKRE